ncbi:MAG: hypothetical protein NTZ35_11970 [Ignavibacteriales bacterium]|nr:hypothetical protein [Ignavibacteriales bacterium]
MSNQILREAQEAFKQALLEGAAQYATDRTEEVERLLLHAKQLNSTDSPEAKDITEKARATASALVALARDERANRKTHYGLEIASLYRSLSETKHLMLQIERKVNSSTFLTLTQRIRNLETTLAQTRHALDRSDFERVNTLLLSAESQLMEISELLRPILRQLSYESPLGTTFRNRQKRRINV